MAALSIQSILTKLANLEESVECVICSDRLQGPVSTVCGHTFCGGCVDKMFEASTPTARRGRGASCPLCNTPLHRRSICQTARTKSIVDAVQKLADQAKKSIKVWNRSLEHI